MRKNKSYVAESVTPNTIYIYIHTYTENEYEEAVTFGLGVDLSREQHRAPPYKTNTLKRVVQLHVIA